MRIVITGASGNLGTALLRRLAADGGHEVVGIARRPPRATGPYAGATWHSLDLTAPDAETGLGAAFKAADAVVHLAWGFQPSRNESYLERLGVGGTRKVLAAAADAGVDHLVHMSSVGVYRAAPGARVPESWATTGVPVSAYSRHKAAAERLLDEHETRHQRPLVTRLRPGFVLQGVAASAFLRYGAPSWFPTSAVRVLRVLPLDRRLVIPVVHADDVADAVVRVLEQRAGGAFNLAAEPPLTRDDIASALRARAVHLPYSVLARLLRASWHAHVQPLDPSWLDLAFAVPLLDTSRARELLGWTPATDALASFGEVVDGMRRGAGTSSPVLRPRSLRRELATLARRGPTSRRTRP